MTLREIMVRARQLRDERPGMPGYDDPASYLNDAVEATDDIATRTHCLYVNFTTDIYSATASYCVPNLYKVKLIKFVDANGNPQDIPTISDPQTTRRYGADWSTTPGQSDPVRKAILSAPNGPIILAPTPSVSRTAALVVGGLWKPGKTWGYDSTGVAVTAGWDVDNPLPLWAQDAIPYAVAAMREDRYPTSPGRFERLSAQSEKRIAQVHGNTQTYTQKPSLSFYVAGPLSGI